MPLLPSLPDFAPESPGLLVGFSGGLDSSVLLDLLARDDRYRGRLRAVHVHHGLQAAADDWAVHCAQVCATLGVPLTVRHVQVATDSGLGLEAAARHARHAVFAELLAHGEVLVTAHHRDDQAETFLLRALRASGTDGLAAMRPWRAFAQGWLWRPLLDTPRAALLAHAQARGLRWIEDPSNADSRQDRNFLRNEVLPLLRQRWPQAEAALAASATLAAESAGLLADGDAEALATARTLDPQVLRLPVLRALPAARRARVLRRWIDERGHPPLPAEGLRQFEQALLPARGDTRARFRWQRSQLQVWDDLLQLGPASPPPPRDWQCAWDGREPLRLPNGDTLQLEGAVQLPADFRVGYRVGGERIRLRGRSHTHALKKLLQEHAIPVWEREALPLLWHPDGSLQAAGDLVLGESLDAWLDAAGARLRWVRTS